MRRLYLWSSTSPATKQSASCSGDNIIQGNIRSAADAYREQGAGAKILLKAVLDPQRFGVPELDGKRVLQIEEKPASPKSEYAVIGIYMYDARVFEIIKTLKPSGRGELKLPTLTMPISSAAK